MEVITMYLLVSHFVAILTGMFLLRLIDEYFKKQIMPKPKPSEKKKDFMIRCVPEVINEGYKSEQAIAICSKYYENKSK